MEAEYKKIISKQEIELGTSDPETMISKNNLSQFYLIQGRISDWETLTQKVGKELDR